FSGIAHHIRGDHWLRVGRNLGSGAAKRYLRNRLTDVPGRNDSMNAPHLEGMGRVNPGNPAMCNKTAQDRGVPDVRPRQIICEATGAAQKALVLDTMDRASDIGVSSLHA